MQDPSFGEAQWREFVEKCWEQQPASWTWSLELNADEVFAAVMAAAEVERWREHTTFVDPFRIALDGAHVLDAETFGALLPTAEDGDLDGFIARVEQMTDLDVGFQVRKVTTYDPLVWERVRAFLRPLFDPLNLVPESIEVDVFFGRYGQTHFGVHRDADSTFTFGLRGEKLFRMWPLDFFTPEMAVEGWPTHIQDDYYQLHRDEAEAVAVRPGTVLYWPSSAWHVGESPNGWSMTLAVALILKPDVYERVKAILSRLLPDPEQVVEPRAYPCQVAERVPAPPLAPRLADALADIRQAMADPRIDLEVELEWLKQVSGLGLVAVPPPADAPFEVGRAYRADPRYPILWKQLAAGTIVAANGYGERVDLPSALVEAHCRRLNAGEVVADGEPALIQRLLAWRAVR